MRLLLDTHVFLCYVTGDSKLSSAAVEAIRDQANDVYLSGFLMWETIIKHNWVSCRFPTHPKQFLPEQRENHLISSLVLDEASIRHLARLPGIHRDPFDRMLVCQAIEHKLTIITVDDSIRAYPVQVF